MHHTGLDLRSLAQKDRHTGSTDKQCMDTKLAHTVCGARSGSLQLIYIQYICSPYTHLKTQQIIF